MPTASGMVDSTARSRGTYGSRAPGQSRKDRLVRSGSARLKIRWVTVEFQELGIDLRPMGLLLISGTTTQKTRSDQDGQNDRYLHVSSQRLRAPTSARLGYQPTCLVQTGPITSEMTLGPLGLSSNRRLIPLTAVPHGKHIDQVVISAFFILEASWMGRRMDSVYLTAWNHQCVKYRSMHTCLHLQVAAEQRNAAYFDEGYENRENIACGSR